MPLTLHDIKPLGLCISTQELFDTKRFLLNYCDGLMLRGDDPKLKNRLAMVKRELNAFRTQMKFLDGYKAIIASNIDKILSLSESRFGKSKPSEVERIVSEGKDLMAKVLGTKGFDDISSMEDDFKAKITLPLYKLFIEDLKRSKMKMI